MAHLENPWSCFIVHVPYLYNAIVQHHPQGPHAITIPMDLMGGILTAWWCWLCPS